MKHGRRLIAVYRADPTGRYGWLPQPRPGDVTVALDGIAGADLAGRRPIPFDRLQSWEQRSAAESRVAELLAAVEQHPTVTAIEQSGFRLIDFAAYRLRMEIALLLRGWTLAGAGAGAQELICDPALPPAMAMGARAGLGLDPAIVPYAVPPSLPGSRRQRAVARQLMRAHAAVSRPERVRVAAVATGKLAHALAALADTDLRAAEVGVMPFPGLDHGNGLLLALRRRLPLFRSYGPARSGDRPRVQLPTRLLLDGSVELDRALTFLVGRLLAGVASEHDQAVRALGGMIGARSLRGLLLPSAAYGASRLLIEWAHRRGLRVGVIQHGIYAFREFDGGDRRADVILGWGEGTSEQTCSWPGHRPDVCPVGVPGTFAGPPRTRPSALRRALVATSNTVDTPLAPAAFCETFVEALTPGLRRLAREGVEIRLRPHPSEDPERYRRLLSERGLDVKIAPDGPFATAIADADLLISSASSVAFEAAALTVPVLLWLGGAPQWVRQRHMVAPWAESAPGTFEGAKDLGLLIDALIDRPAQGFRVASELSRHLARYAEPFDVGRFAAALHALAA
jgi:hypothetical protein